MDAVCLEWVFDSTFGFVEVNFGGYEKCKPNGISLVHN